jgi:hypothetical protein
MNRLHNVFAWEAGEKWRYSEARDLAAPIAVEVERYESEGLILLYRPYSDSGTLIWNAEMVE